MRTGDENKLQFIFATIRDNLDETKQRNVNALYVVSIRGPSVKLLIRGRQVYTRLQDKAVALFDELNSQGNRLDDCGYVLHLFGLKA